VLINLAERREKAQRRVCVCPAAVIRLVLTVKSQPPSAALQNEALPALTAITDQRFKLHLGFPLARIENA
jgi:hypothetical protein